MLTRKWKIGLGVALVSAVIAGVSLAGSLKGVPVETARISEGDLAVTVRGTGEVKLRDPVYVVSEVGGRVATVPVKEGDRVAAGDLIIALDTAFLEGRLTQLTAERRALEAQLAEAREQTGIALELATFALKQAETDLERAVFLHEQAAISNRELEAAQLARNVAERTAKQSEVGQLGVATLAAQVQAATALVRQAERELALARVSAGIDGVILARNVDPGVVIAPGTALFTLGDPEALTIEARIEPRDATAVKNGQTVRVTHLAGGASVATGVVNRVATTGITTVSPLGVKEAKAKIEIDVTDGIEHLKAGYGVNIEILVDQTAAAAVVPESAVFRQAGRTVLFVVRQGQAQLVEVVPGRRAGGLIEVSGEIKTGETVIVNPPPEVKDGTRVSP
ncbi:MAG: efflux RND transporter periplasmic adaptor subunit [Eubacteriales bacterium]|nr:efflux RND transporter periplasmic adaptor subunit [Bacillota bacterium]MDQ7788735.1 efflux RND transporter periplasmic adaptor subunit [Clostridia bacterium]MDZ4043577.1 efflux RND transporter periplasmic adaptor subunit [Eubacteriales bacterium]MDZ7609510.1 efflux RND transporter periplasmic adaptor subunit [Eubacteriales bacterium]